MRSGVVSNGRRDNGKEREKGRRTKVEEDLVHLANVEFDTVVAKAVLELLLVKLFVAARVHDGQRAAQGLDAALCAAALENLGDDALDDSARAGALLVLAKL